MIGNKEIKKLFRESFYLIAGATIVAFIVNLVNPAGFVLVNKDMINNTKLVRISVQEAKIKFDLESALFIDSRNYSKYNREHVRGALNIPASPESLSVKKIQEYFSRLNVPIELVIYCDGNSCSNSDIIAKRLQDMGYKKHLYILTMGIPVWKSSGYPVEGKSEGVESDGKN